MAKNPSILIVGAGVAGISAACRLIENGLNNIKIFEAENRIGGRIYSVKEDNSHVDFGGQWCHGETGNIIHSLAKPFEAIAPAWCTYENTTFYESSGKVIEEDIATKLQNFYFEYMAHDKDVPGSFGENFIKDYNEYVKEIFGNNKECLAKANLMLDWFHKLMLCYDSAPNWNEILANSNYEVLEGNQLQHWKDKGFKFVLDLLMKKYPDAKKAISVEEKVVLSKEVSKIIWHNKHAGVVVQSTDGLQEKFDHVIVTVSLGVLKENYKYLFEPSLPVYKQTAIEAMSFGLVNKILLKFPKRWWPKETKGFSLIWKNDDRMNIINEFNFGPIKNGKSWLEDVFGFYVLDSHPNILLGWIVGEFARDFENMPDEIIGNGCMYLLKKFVGDKFEITPLEKVMCSRWYTNKPFRGSYSFSSVKQEQYKVTNADLAQPLYGNDGVANVLFAGEATHSTHFSTAHGAIETGHREADRLIDMYKNEAKFIGDMNGSLKSHL